VTERDLDLPGGTVHAELRGPDDGPLVVCVHGLSANLRGFDAIAPPLAEAGHRVAAIDLRGRGGSPATAPGTYGLAAHARDVVAVADALGAERFAVVGWSLGALIGLHVAGQAGERLEALVMLDHAGGMDEGAVEAVRRGLERLDAVVPSPEPYLDALRAAGAASPWGPFWEAYYRYELVEQPDGSWRSRTDKAACLEDFHWVLDHPSDELWAKLSMPVLLVRATVPLNNGLIVPADVRDALRAAVADLQLVEVARNHFGIMDHPDVAEAIRRRLAPG
jgi:pimeloyl-ACP methyl ester carboxylesterase